MRVKFLQLEGRFFFLLLVFALGVSPVFLPAAQNPGEEDLALTRIFQDQSDSVSLVRRLEAHLDRYPNTRHRIRIFRNLFTRSMEIQDHARAFDYGGRLFEETPEDRTLLLRLIELSQFSGVEDFAKAVKYATLLVRAADEMTASLDPLDSPGNEGDDTTRKFASAAYLIRGEVYAKAGQDSSAENDFRRSLSLHPLPEAAQRSAELAEKRGDLDQAIEHYGAAFVIPSDPPDPGLQWKIRQKLGTLYRQRHGSESGMGEWLLARYDEWNRRMAGDREQEENPNAQVTDAFEYTLKRLDGSPFQLSEYDGRVLIVDFWATWCAPCRTEGELLEEVIDDYHSNPDVAFLAVNTDHDRSGVEDFLREEGWTIPIAYASGIDVFLNVRVIPTLMIFDRNRRMTFRQEGFSAFGFIAILERKIEEALNGQSSED